MALSIEDAFTCHFSTIVAFTQCAIALELQKKKKIKPKKTVELLNLEAQLIKKEDTKIRKTIPADQRLSVTLFYLATGQSRRSLSWSYRISHNLISAIIPEVCQAIYAVLGEHTSNYQRHQQNASVASAFHDMWNFPFCLGALDGKRVLVRKPANSGSEYFDYKTHHSIIMLALVDANYKFLYVDIGTKGRASDAGVWDKCTLRDCIEKQQLQIPQNDTLPYTNIRVAYVIVDDDAFPLKCYLMKPYPGKNITNVQRVFNYRLSRARRISENAFGILASKFRVLLQPIASKPEFVKNIIFAAVVLHNFLRVKSGNPVRPEMLMREDHEKGILIPGDLEVVPNAMENLQPTARGHSHEAKRVRNTMGSVSWQERVANLH
ncbi:protein ALP1-like [Penaeus monodon]|uniref:protein ALP1-like n=1 Tax=Penaeus monodon TaxID=6687 RepID=UPI0018A6E405|nr:protein ALP1-like [Penaeus monodon]